MTFKIEKDVPIPAIPQAGRPRLYPFAEMEIGDSFSVPLSGVRVKANSGYTDKAARNLVSAASIYSKKCGIKFSTRTLHGEGVVRCWRVS
jgi:hypothetical protein